MQFLIEPRIFLLVFGLHVVMTDVSNTNEDVTLIETNSGAVQGKIVTGFTKKDVRAFYGIPYAEPPLGKLRFKPPVPIQPWTHVFDATRVPLPCYQHYTKESLKLERKLNTVVRRPWSEDCLTLNVWTPVEISLETPVAVMFHGGNFKTGSGAFPYYDYSTHSAEAKVVFISLNYRVGAFGFLSFGTPDTPGNLGLMDQHLALKWINENVAHFGGKTGAIFLYAVEAGAASVGHQAMFAENAGLFKGIIIYSGSPVCSWAWQSKEKAMELGKTLSRILGCEKYNLTRELECLQNAHPEDILDGSLASESTSSLHFRPNVDGFFIKDEPIESLKAGRIINVTIIINNCVQDGSLKFWTLNNDIIKETEGYLKDVDDFRKAIERSGLAVTATELDLISDWYLGGECPVSDTYLRRAAVEAYSDGRSICCSEEFIDLVSRQGLPAFKFVFDTPDPRFPLWIGAHDQWMWILLFTPEVFKPEKHYSSEFVQLAKGTMIAVGKFTREKVADFQNTWPPYNSVERSYTLWSSEIKTSRNHRTNECVLWNEIIPELRKRERIS